MTVGAVAGQGAGPGGPADPDVLVQRDGAVLTVTLNRPDRLNALTAPMLDTLEAALASAAGDPSVRVVVLAGAGRAFSSGADLSAGLAPVVAGQAGEDSDQAGEDSDQAGEDSDQAGERRPSLDTLLAANRVVRALQTLPQPTVAAVGGPAVGVGCSLALACDLVVATQEAYFLLAFTRIGLMPDGGATLLVPASIGRARAMAMALLAERISADQAYAWGLVSRLVPAAELDAAVGALTGQLVAGPPLALAATKRAVNAATLPGLEPVLTIETEGQSALLASADFREGVAAFATRRPPHFTGD